MCSVLRTVLIKLSHEGTYEQVAYNMTNSQIGTRKTFICFKFHHCDVMNSKKKVPIYLNVMDFKQMFDAEELQTVLNSYYEAGIKNYLFSIVYEANKTVTFAV